MPAPISIVIPTLNVADRIEPVLAALYPGVSEGLIQELIFADGGSSDAIKEVADRWGATLLTADQGRGSQLRAGVFAAKGEWVFIIHADTRLSQDWVHLVRNHISVSKTAAYGCLRFDAKGVFPYITSRWANFRSRVFGLPYGDQTLLIRQTLYQKVGGYPDIPLMEDVALARALRGQLSPLSFTATTSAEKYIKRGWLIQGARNLSFLIRFLLGADPKKLADKY